MAPKFHKAERKKSKLRLALAGPAGSGKTYSALLIAFGLGGKVAMIDTERGSGELYDYLGEYDVCTLEAPFTPEKYTEAIKEAEKVYDVIIIDSLSHAWAGEGGLLDIHGHIADRSGNSWAAWRQVTPRHNELVEAMLQSKSHIIATMRSKMEYTQVEENGKKSIKKLGMNPIQRDGMEYEFTVFFDLDHNHVATASKDRTSLFDGKFFKPSKETGKILLGWLENGTANHAVSVDGLSVGTLKTDTENLNPPKSESEEPKPRKQNGGNGLKILFAKLGSFKLDKEKYKVYCYQKYGIDSMTRLTSEQRKEQSKILDSLKNPERLKEFKALLDSLPSREEYKRNLSEANPEDTLKGIPKEAKPPLEVPGEVAAQEEFNLF